MAYMAIAKYLEEEPKEVARMANGGANSFLQAARTGTIKVVSRLLNFGADGLVTSTDYLGRTALHLAALDGREKVVEVLVCPGRTSRLELRARGVLGLDEIQGSKGYERVGKGLPLLEAKDNAGKTPMLLAAENNHKMIITLLLEVGGSVKAKDRDGRTALHWGALKGHEEVVEGLLQAGAVVEAQNVRGKTPLHWAVENGYTRTTKLLLDAGGSVSTKDKEGRTALHWGVRKGHTGTATMLLGAGADVEAKDSKGLSALHVSAINGQGGVAKVLLDAGADVGATDSGGGRPLHYAAQKGFEGLATILLDSGAVVDEKDVEGWTPLHFAASNGPDEVTGNTAVVTVLLSAGADVAANVKPLHPTHERCSLHPRPHPP